MKIKLALVLLIGLFGISTMAMADTTGASVNSQKEQITKFYDGKIADQKKSFESHLADLNKEYAQKKSAAEARYQSAIAGKKDAKVKSELAAKHKTEIDSISNDQKAAIEKLHQQHDAAVAQLEKERQAKLNSVK